jgi:hypothetical protein
MLILVQVIFLKKTQCQESTTVLCILNGGDHQKKIIPIDKIEGPAHALLVHENVRDVESAEYVVNNFVDLNTYWKVY